MLFGRVIYNDKFERIIPDKYQDHRIYYLAYDHLIDKLEKTWIQRLRLR